MADRSIQIRATAWATCQEAHAHAKQNPGVDAVLLNARPYTVTKAVARRLENEGADFAYLHTATRGDGRSVIVTVPVR